MTLVFSQDLNTSQADESAVENVNELEVADGTNPTSEPVPMADHLSDVPPTQLLDGGSEDMDMVSCHGDVVMDKSCNDVLVLQSEIEEPEDRGGESYVY